MAVIILGVWLAVQIVSLMPQAFTSLASIADGVYNANGTPELTVSTDNSSVMSGDSFMINWTSIPGSGAYTFMYTCTDGVAVTITENTGSPTLVPCNDSVTLGNKMTSLEVMIDSERERMSDVEYAIAYFRQGEAEPVTISSNSITVINPSIPDGDTVAIDESTEGEDESEDTPKPEVAGESTEVDPEPEPEVSTPLPPAPTVIETVVMETPVSDPNGRTDLAVRLVAVGHLASNGNFIPRANVDNDARGAFQFEVRNIGTKTSTAWDFKAMLTSGTEYDAPAQTPLKPQERVLFTLGYDNVGENGINLIGVTVRGGSDVNSTNNSFTWAVSVVE